MKKAALILIALCAAGMLAAGGRAETEGPKPLVVAMELQYPPFEMSDAAGNPIGISVGIAEALGEFLGRPVVIENTAWTGLIPSLQTGKADIIISSMTITEERSRVVDFSDPYVQSGLTLLIAADSPVENFNDLNQPGRIVAVKSGTTGAHIARERLTNAEVRLFDEVSACVLEVSQGKADAFIYDALTVYENHKKHPNTTRINIQSIQGTDSYWGMAVRKDQEEFLAEVNAFIRKFRASGGFNALADRYLGEQKTIFDEYGVSFFFDL